MQAWLHTFLFPLSTLFVHLKKIKFISFNYLKQYVVRNVLYCLLTNLTFFHVLNFCFKIVNSQPQRCRDWKFKKSIQCILRFVNFSFPKNPATNEVLSKNRGSTNRRIHCILIKNLFYTFSFLNVL